VTRFPGVSNALDWIVSSSERERHTFSPVTLQMQIQRENVARNFHARACLHDQTRFYFVISSKNTTKKAAFTARERHTFHSIPPGRIHQNHLAQQFSEG
jgi:hypothetical protein